MNLPHAANCKPSDLAARPVKDKNQSGKSATNWLLPAKQVSYFISDLEVTCGDSHVKTNVSETLVYKLSALSDVFTTAAHQK